MGADRVEYEEWICVVRSLENVVQYYDKMNEVNTFFQVERWRRAAADFSGKELQILDIGCGPGSFSEHLRGRKIVCMDPSKLLLGVARSRLDTDKEFLRGEAEHLPLGSDSFDRIFCSFSFRDFRDKRKSLEEIHRVLRKDGLAVIIEIAKQKGKIRSALLKLHLKYNVPILARLMIPRNRMRLMSENPYGYLWKTYERLMNPERYAEIMREIGYADVKWKLLSLGGASILWGRKR